MTVLDNLPEVPKEWNARFGLERTDRPRLYDLLLIENESGQVLESSAYEIHENSQPDIELRRLASDLLRSHAKYLEHQKWVALAEKNLSLPEGFKYTASGYGKFRVTSEEFDFYEVAINQEGLDRIVTKANKFRALADQLEEALEK